MALTLGLTSLVGLGLGGLGLLSSGVQAIQNNQAIDQAIDSTDEAARAQQDQVMLRRRTDVQEQQAQTARNRGRLSASLATQGGGIDPSLLLAQNLRGLRNEAILADNATAQAEAITSQRNARVNDLSAGRRSVLLGSALGGASGLSTGLGLGIAANQLFNP